MRPVHRSAPLVRLLLALIVMVLASVGTMARAELPARPSGPILDAASVIPPAEEAALDRKLRDYNMRTGRALMVVTVTSLDGEDVATYANNLGHAWGVGGKDSDQGLIFLVAPTERKVRIETGYGLEQYLPDVLASRIIRDQVTPKFKADDIPGGINAGIDAITTQLDRDPAEAKAVAEAAKAAAAQRSNTSSGGPSVIVWLIALIVLISLFNRRGRRGYRRSGIDPGIILWGLSEAMHHGRGGGSDWGGLGGGSGGGGGSDWGGFGGGDFGGGGASGDW